MTCKLTLCRLYQAVGCRRWHLSSLAPYPLWWQRHPHQRHALGSHGHRCCHRCSCFLLLIIAQTEAAVRGATDCPVTPGCGRKTGDERVKKKKKKKDRCHGLFHSCNWSVQLLCSKWLHHVKGSRVFVAHTLLTTSQFNADKELRTISVWFGFHDILQHLC